MSCGSCGWGLADGMPTAGQPRLNAPNSVWRPDEGSIRCACATRAMAIRNGRLWENDIRWWVSLCFIDFFSSSSTQTSEFWKILKVWNGKVSFQMGFITFPSKFNRQELDDEWSQAQLDAWTNLSARFDEPRRDAQKCPYQYMRQIHANTPIILPHAFKKLFKNI